MLGIFLDKETVDLGDIDFSALDNSLKKCADEGAASTRQSTAGAGFPNLIGTPHSAWASRESRQRMVQQLAENIQAFLSGHPLRVVCMG